VTGASPRYHRGVKLKRKHKKRIAIAAIVGGFLLFCWGVYRNQTLPPELGISHPDWWERSQERGDQEFYAFLWMGVGGMGVFAGVNEIVRQARKLKMPT
jgi:hypothetical protein